jgi:AraC family transcriptional regulator
MTLRGKISKISHLGFMETDLLPETLPFRGAGQDAFATLVCLHVSDDFITQISPERKWCDIVIHHWRALPGGDLLTLEVLMLITELCRRHEQQHSLHLRVTGLFLGAQLLRMRTRRDAQMQKFAGMPPSQLGRVQQWISAHLSDRIEVKDLARVANISKTHFSRLFKASTGYPPHRYILTQRIHRALELLQRGGLRMSEIAAASGFADQSHMSRSLRKFYGRLLSGEKGSENSTL